MTQIRIENGFKKLQEKGRLLHKAGGKQIALFLRGDVVYACNNRCPHEGYPLIEGQFDADGSGAACLLTCSWHNWKFDLVDGQNQYEGDHLRIYPVMVEKPDILVDISDPAPEILIETALANMKDAFPRHDYERIAREIARLHKAGAPMDLAVQKTLLWVNDQFQWGMSHAHAAAVDWLRLYDQNREAENWVKAIANITEIVGHLVWDTMREPQFPYAEPASSYSENDLLTALEAEQEEQAISQVKAAFASGLGFYDLEPIFAKSVFQHFRDFGHSAIYLEKLGRLIDRFGSDVEEALTLCFVRSLVYSWREDDIPEFKEYGPSLQQWGKAEGAVTKEAVTKEAIKGQDFAGISVRKALEQTLALSHLPPEKIYQKLLYGVSWNLAHYDVRYGRHTDLPVSQNQSWLALTHGLTFANAVRKLCEKYPDYWPQGLLQIACFIGRNKSYIKPDLDISRWQVEDVDAFFGEAYEQLHDHAQPEYIISAHLVKTVTAAEEEIRRESQEACPGYSDWQGLLLAGLNRFLKTGVKGKHVLRSAKQALALVASEN